MGEAIAMTWQEIAASKQAERAAKLPAEWLIPASLLPAPEQLSVQDFPATSGFFTDRELEITNSTASEVVGKIASGEWASLEVTKAVCKRATVAQQLVNCLTEIYFEEAFKRAAELDEIFKKAGRTVGPLHGLPIR
jgi:amidase